MSSAAFHAFLSHNSADKPAVKLVAEELERAKLRPWLDAWHLVPGEAWQPAIEEALRKSDCCVVFVGPSGIGAWQHEEMRAAINRRVTAARDGAPFRVIPVLLPGAVRGYRSHLPEFLTATTWVEFRSTDDAAALRTLERAVRGLPPRAEREATHVECPYRGLAAFDVSDADVFFGREAVTDWLLSVLRGTQSPVGPSRFQVIVGASGSGKSSLARAGVLAALKRGEIDGSQNWLFTICKPGARPLESLAGELAATEGINLGEGLSTKLIRELIDEMRSHAATLHLTSHKNLGAGAETRRHVVLIDQFEEVFAQCHDAGERNAFIDNLLHAGRVSGGRTIVLLTMRADFYENCAAHAALSTAISDSSFLLSPLSADELRSAIERPTQMCRGTVEPGLTELLIQDMAHQEQALPLLQHALRQLWDAAAKSELRLTVEA
ncbi:MAG TPA: toll/interleukin-1 receptor domain-containing protein, partial [Pirellulaceae bacterium]|nr:toll/interleukin-1 receptor domain-containing protein [Pirellulaceae bacterium]